MDRNCWMPKNPDVKGRSFELRTWKYNNRTDQRMKKMADV